MAQGYIRPAASAEGITTQLFKGAYEVIDRKLDRNSNIYPLDRDLLPRMAATPTSFLPALSPNDIDRAAQASCSPVSIFCSLITVREI